MAQETMKFLALMLKRSIASPHVFPAIPYLINSPAPLPSLISPEALPAAII